jgi:hypothetical protein
VFVQDQDRPPPRLPRWPDCQTAGLAEQLEPLSSVAYAPLVVDMSGAEPDVLLARTSCPYRPDVGGQPRRTDEAGVTFSTLVWSIVVAHGGSRLRGASR